MSKPIGLQLYSVRHMLAEDLEGTLKKVAGMGYDAVEFFGALDKPAERLAAALKDAGLTCCGWHTPWDAVQPQNLYPTIEYFKAVGCQSVVVPGLPGECYETIEAWKKAVRYLDSIAPVLAGYGMTIGYHNHDVEFRPVDGQSPFDAFIESTSSALNWQFDIGNALAGKVADPVALIEKYPERIHNIHAKPWSKDNGFDCVIGGDDVDWAKVVRMGESNPGTVGYIVEFELEGKEEEGVRLCLEGLKKVLG